MQKSFFFHSFSYCLGFGLCVLFRHILANWQAMFSFSFTDDDDGKIDRSFVLWIKENRIVNRECWLNVRGKNRCACAQLFPIWLIQSKTCNNQKKQNRTENSIEFIHLFGRSVSQYLMYITYGYLAVINPIIHPSIHSSIVFHSFFFSLIWFDRNQIWIIGKHLQDNIIHQTP